MSLSDDEWCRFLAGSLSIPGRIAPPLPPPEFQQSWVGRSGESAFQEGAVFVRHLKTRLHGAGDPIARGTRTLDFGCGWGRFSRLLMRDVDRLVGADPDAHCIDICSAIPGAEFVLISDTPPTPFHDGAFDLALAYSLFTHLAEPVAQRVLVEIARLIRPGGYFAFTTLPFGVWEREQANHPVYARLEWRQQADHGEHLFMPTGGGGHMTNDVYGWALVSRPCLERMIRALPFSLVAMEPVADLPQQFALLRRK